MNAFLDGLVIALLTPLDWVFGQRWVAPFVFAPLMIGWAVILSLRARREIKPFISAADARSRALRDALGTETAPDAERRSFSDRYVEVATAFNRQEAGSENLVSAWREFTESIVDETETPIRNTSRPRIYFSGAVPSQEKIIFWSNTLLGLGLLLTFLGLISALDVSLKTITAGSDTVGSGGSDPASMQQSLTQLLEVASAKFFTSVAGVGASLILRSAAHDVRQKANEAIDGICKLLERGLLYVPPQRLAVEQLGELKEQSAQLKTFNTDFALQVSEKIGAQFQTALAPLKSSMDNLGKTIGQGAGEAVSQAAGGELRALGHTLTVLGEKLEALGSQVGASGDQAAEQIRAAGADFATAATDIRAAFDRLAGNVDGMGKSFREQNEAAAKAQQDALADILAKISDAQKQSSDSVREAVKAIAAAGTRTGAALEKEVTKALADGVKGSREALGKALEESGETLRGVSAGLAKAIGEAAAQVERAQLGFEKSGDSAARTAEVMTGVTSSASSVASALSGAADGFAKAAAPVAEAARSVGEAATRVSRSIEAGREMDAQALDALKTLAEEMRATQEAAEGAWQDYRARFEGVDRALAGAVEKMGETVGGSLDQFRSFAQDFDMQLAGAVTKLSSTLDAIQEYAESLDQFVDSSRQQG